MEEVVDYSMDRVERRIPYPLVNRNVCFSSHQKYLDIEDIIGIAGAPLSIKM